MYSKIFKQYNKREADMNLIRSPEQTLNIRYYSRFMLGSY